MIDKPTPTDAATPECLDCSDHGAVGNSGFDHKTAADFLSGKTVSDEALRQFVVAAKCTHDARAALHARMLLLQGELASREAEIALLKRSLLDAAASASAPQPPTAAPATQQPEGGVVAYLDVGANGYLDLGSELSEDALQQLPKGRHALVIAGTYGIDGYIAAPQPSYTAQAADSVQEDAALWRWLAEYLVGTRTDLDDEIVASETVNDLRKLVKAAIKQGEKQ